MTKYAVLISTGTHSGYRRLVGWDRLCDTRAEAEAIEKEADEQDGWSSKVIEVTGDEIEQWNETVDEMLARRQREAFARVPK